MELDLNNPEIQDVIKSEAQKLVEQEVQGLKSKNSDLLGKNNKLKTELDTFKGQFEGLDIEAVKNIIAKSGADEEIKLIAEGKLDEVFNRRTERLKLEHGKALQALQTSSEKDKVRIGALESLAIEGSLASAASSCGLQEGAVKLLLPRARSTFTVNEKGDAVALDEDGNLVMGKDGSTPLTTKEWIESMRDESPFLFKEPTGTGAGKSIQGVPTLNQKRSEMTPSQRTEFIAKYGQDKYLKLPK